MGNKARKLEFKSTRDYRIKKRGEFYYARFSKDGFRIQESLQTKSFETAKIKVDEIEKRILIQEDWTDEKSPVFEDAILEFLEDRKTGALQEQGIKIARESTIKEYENKNAKYFTPYFGAMRVDRIGLDEWRGYMKWVYVQRKSEGKEGEIKFFNHWKCLRAFFRWCLVKKYIKERPLIYNPDPKADDDEEEGEGKVYSDQELIGFQEGSEGPMRLWIFMGQYMGMRNREITALRRAAISLNKKIIRLKKSEVKTGSKTNRGRTIPIHPEVMPLLVEQLASHEEPYVFPHRFKSGVPMDEGGFRRNWEALRDEVSPGGKFHYFRHTYCTKAFANPKLNPLMVANALGMDIRTAQKVYIHYKPEQYQVIAQNFNIIEDQSLWFNSGTEGISNEGKKP